MSDKVSLSLSAVSEGRRIVYGVVYTPNMLDNYGGFADPAQVEELAYSFLTSVDPNNAIDVMHDNVPTTCYPVESFIARDNDPDFPTGSWVLGVKVPDDVLWTKILNGDLNAFSMEVYITRRLVDVEVELSPVYVGYTEENTTKANVESVISPEPHTHVFYVELNEKGDILRGVTSETDGHTHTITRNSVTDVAENHSHRIMVINNESPNKK